MEERIMAELGAIKNYTLLSAKNVLTIDEVALFTGLSKAFLYKLTSERKIPHYKRNGKLIYFDKAEIENWMKQGRVNSVDEAEYEASRYLMSRGGVA